MFIISKRLLAYSWSVEFEPGISVFGYIAVFIAMDLSCAQINSPSHHFKYVKHVSMLV